MNIEQKVPSIEAQIYWKVHEYERRNNRRPNRIILGMEEYNELLKKINLPSSIFDYCYQGMYVIPSKRKRYLMVYKTGDFRKFKTFILGAESIMINATVI